VPEGGIMQLLPLELVLGATILSEAASMLRFTVAALRKAGTFDFLDAVLLEMATSLLPFTRFILVGAACSGSRCGRTACSCNTV
jgi:hypothetical protein